MDTNVIFSIIVPQRNSIDTIPRLMNSIPEREDIEIIIVDNTPTPITKEEIGIDRDYQLLWSAPERHAGGARNVGIENAHGKWLLFADADDYFADGAFEVFFSKAESDAEIVYTGMGGIYPETGEKSDRGDVYAKLVHDYLTGEKTEEDLRLNFVSPCCKMVSRGLVERHHIRYDEIRAANDAYFSHVSGYYATQIEAVDFVSYIATVSKGSLTMRRDYEVIKSRLYATLHCNQFLKRIGCSRRQYSIMYALYESKHYGLKAFFEFCGMIISFRQNPLIGCKHWLNSLKNSSVQDMKNKKYIVR